MPTLSIPNPEKDLSYLLFTTRDAPPPKVLFGPNDYFIGPIQVTSINVQHGLGVIATRDIEQGECLFVTKAAVSADVQEVYQKWKKNSNNESLEQITEQVLVQAMRETMESDNGRATAKSFLLQLTNDNRKAKVPDNPTELLSALVGKGDCSDAADWEDMNDQQLLQIIRKNAFGPDFTSYDSVEQKWNDSSSPTLPARLLGLYPLAAMINQSCLPNALRVFCSGDWMMVHASAAIKKGEEVVWSYLPPILPFPQRRKQLEDCHGFVCQCPRCQNEQQAAETNPKLYVVPESLQDYNTIMDEPSRQQFTQSLADWEKQSLTQSLSNETKRYWKMGHAKLYIHNMNVQLTDIRSKPPSQQEQIRTRVLLQAMDLHFCFVGCHNYACTEHLSVLHLCYELVAVLHTQSTDPSKTMPKVQFWTEQLKRAHLVRYGALGNDVNRVRAVMKHTQVVLRHANGLDQVPYEFI